MKLILHIFLLLASSITLAQSSIDAAFSWNTNTIYFIKGNTVVKYNSSNNAIIATTGLEQAFPGISFSQIDAALDYGNGKVYLFSGKQYARLDKQTGRIDDNYPKNISDQWVGVNFDRIDAAVTWPNGKTYFFNGSNYIRYDNANTSADASYPKAITSKTWPGLNLNSVDAILNFENGKTYFFKGNQYYRFDESSDRLDEGYPKSLDLWQGVQAALESKTNNNTVNNNSNNNGMEFSHDSWNETLLKAKASGKLIFVDAYAEWCPPCKRMAANVFPLAEVGEVYNKNFINYKMDCEKGDGPSFLRKYAIAAYPTLLFIDGDGKVVKQVVGGQSAEQLISVGKEVAKTSSTTNTKGNLNGTGGTN
jgi:thiol-disulfide isomerase/thioredoxin